MNHYDNPDWRPWLLIAMVGAVIVAAGIACQVIQLYVSFRDAKLPANQDLTGDPWDGRTLEWSMSSPPPAYNFAVLPTVYGLDSFHIEKERNLRGTDKQFEPIHMPKNTAAGFFVGAFSFAIGFGAVWYIWWMVIFGLLGVAGTIIARSMDTDIDFYVPVSEVSRADEEHVRNLMAQAAE